MKQLLNDTTPEELSGYVSPLKRLPSNVPVSWNSLFLAGFTLGSNNISLSMHTYLIRLIYYQ
jgi:hypothetical protein